MGQLALRLFCAVIEVVMRYTLWEEHAIKILENYILSKEIFELMGKKQVDNKRNYITRRLIFL